MIVPVFTPPPTIDASHVVEFSRTVSDYVDRYGCMVIDCSDVEWIIGVGMHVLETASRDAPITLVNPNPSVHLMAATFGGDVQCRYDRLDSLMSQPGMEPCRLRSVPASGKVAS